MLPTLSRLTVSCRPVIRLRHWCSSLYLRISPLHKEFRLPLRHSRSAVSNARHRLSLCFSHRTCLPGCTPFTPSKSGQRLPPTYYRGCWHVVSRGLFREYRLPLFLPKRSLQPESLLPSRGVAGSGLRPLPNIPHCCLPQESGPYLSPNVAGQPLSPATDRRLGEPLPHQLSNQTRGHPLAINL